MGECLDLLNLGHHGGHQEKKILKFVTLDCRKIHLQTPEELKMFLKNLSTMANILNKSHDMMLKLHKKRKQT